MSGGEQFRLRATLEKAGLSKHILERLKKGNIIISGTNVGDSVMAEVMMSKSVLNKEKGILMPALSYGLKLWP